MYTYTPAYYSSFQETVTTLCKSILLPFSHKNRRLPADQKLAKKQSDHLKWQQESFHKILNLIELQKEGIVSESEVDSFKSLLLDTLIASPSEKEAIEVVKDKLLFLQELYYAKCISSEEYHSSKRPLLQRLAVEGVEIDCKDVIIGKITTKVQEKENEEEEEWSNVDLKDKEINEAQTENSKKHKTPIKSLMKWKGKDKKDSNKKPTNNENSSSILVPEIATKVKRRPFVSLFDKEDNANIDKSKKIKKQWRFEGFTKWKKSDVEEVESTSLFDCTIVASPTGEEHDTKGIKEKIHPDGSSSNIKKEITRIQSEFSSTHPNLNLLDDEREEISSRLPVDKTDLNKFFPKYGDMVLDVANKGSRGHVGETEMILNNDKEKSICSNDDLKKWVAFNDDDNDENYHPKLFFKDDPKLHGGRNSGSYGKDCFLNNPFVDDQDPFFVSKN